MSQMGRPKSDNPKSEQVTVRLDREHSQILKDYCEKEKVEPITLARTIILIALQPPKRLVNLLYHSFGELSKARNNKNVW